MASTMAQRGPDDEAIWCGDERRVCVSPARRHRSARALEPADAVRALAHGFQRGDLQLPSSCATSSACADTASRPRATGRCCCTRGPSGARRRSTASTACSPSRSGTAERALTLASDPFGEKPVYYAEDASRLVFGSRLAAITAGVGRALAADEDALAGYVSRGAFPTPDGSFAAGVRRLPAPTCCTGPAAGRACAATGLRARERRRGATATRWPRCETCLKARSHCACAATSGRHLAERRRGLRRPWSPSWVRRVPRAPTQLHRALPRVRARRVELRAGRGGGGRRSEHHAVEPRAADLARDLDRLVADHEEPVVSSSVYAQWRVMRCAHEVGITVLLDGQGGDELFAGYPEVDRLRAALGRAPRTACASGASLAAPPALAGSLALEGARRTRAGHRAAALYRRRRRLALRGARGPRRTAETSYEAWQQAADPLRRELLPAGLPHRPAPSSCAMRIAAAWPTAARYGCRCSTGGSPSSRTACPPRS